MKFGFYVCLTFFVVVKFSSIIRAEPAALDPERLLFNEQGKVSSFETKQPSEMMSLAEFDRYKEALSKIDCETAGRLLHKSFVRTYPQFKSAKTRFDCEPVEFSDCYYWGTYAQDKFKDYALCTIEEDLQRVAKELLKYGNQIPKYALPRFPKTKFYDDPFLRSRDRALSNLIGDAESGYVPALEKVAGLLRQGDVFEAKSDVEYYVLRLVCIHGSDCFRWQGRLAGLKTTLGAKRSEHIDAIAKKTTLRQPRLNDLILGKPL